MLNYFKAICVILFLVGTFSPSSVSACGDMKASSHSKSSSKSEKYKHNNKKECCKTTKAAKNHCKHDCEGNCSSHSCKCLTSTVFYILPGTFDIKQGFLFISREVLIPYYVISDTSSGFYSNWQPPKIG